MPWLIESDEWVLIHRLGSILAERTGRYVPRHQKSSGGAERGERFHDKLFDSELAKVFLLTGLASSGLNLSTAAFDRGQEVFNSVCDLLNSLVKAEFSQVDPDEDLVVDSKYPALEGLAQYLEGLGSKNSKEHFDLATGPFRKLFELPDDASLKPGLDQLTRWNDSIGRLLSDPHDEASNAKPKTKLQPWMNTQLRDRATDAFHILFKDQRCQSHHEVKLSLTHCAESSWLNPTLNLWYFCSHSNHWQEVVYDLSR